MKIVVLTGSPRKNSNSTYLAEQFIKGAEEQGHEVFRFDCAFKQAKPCRACNRCGMDGPCIFNDDFYLILKQCEMITCITLATMQTLPQLKAHAGAALNVGVTPEELREVMYLTAPFIGFPAAIKALRIIKQEYAK